MMNERIADAEMSSIVLSNAVKNAHYASKVLPYLKDDYFPDSTERAICKTMVGYFNEYGKCPSVQELVVGLKDLPEVHNLDKTVVNDVLGNSHYEVTNQEWLVKHTEQFIRRRRVSAAFEQTYGDFERGEQIDSFANIFQEALAFHFDNSVGHSFVNDAAGRYELYTSDEDRMPFLLEMLDLVTNGGMPVGTLNCFLAGTGVGKSLLMCSLASQQAMKGYKVLYISMEMAELRLAERIEANLMDVPLSDMKKMSAGDFKVRQDLYIEHLKKVGGDICFKQYPTSSAHTGHFRNLLIEYKNKQGIEFDVIYVDYLNICATARGNASDNSYTRIKNIAEELRALAVEFNVPIITATQTNRDGQASTDLRFEDVSESHGLSATVDCLFGLMSNDEWEKTGKLMIGQIKNRYGDPNFYKKFMVGIERSKMRLYNLKREASDGINEGQTQKPASSTPAAMAGAIDLSVLGAKKVTDLSKLNIGT